MSDEDRRDYRSLGEILSDAREQRDWTVGEVSDRTKITRRQIHALESDDLASLSGPVYARGFLRSLCELYDLDREWLMMKLDSYLESVSDTPEASVPAPVAPPKTTSEPAAPTASEESPAPESTWTVETVETSRVYRMRPAPKRVPPRWVWLLLFLVVAALVVWGVATRGRFTSSTGLAESVSPSAPVVDVGGEKPSLVDAPTKDLVASHPGEETSDVAAAELPKEMNQATADEVSDDKGAPADEDEPAVVVSSANVEEGDQRRVRYVDSPGEGIKSVLRQSAEDKQEFSLKLIATGLVTARVAFDDQPHQSRRMKAGDEWLLKAIDHFSVEFSDVSKVVIEVDGVRREAPRGLRGEWWLYRTATPTDSN